MAKTPCPRCGAAIRIPRAPEGSCASCGLEVRFEDVPSRPCDRCGKPVALTGDLVRCRACGRGQAANPKRPVRGEATCPRCRRNIAVDLDATEAACPHCGEEMALADATA